MKMKLSILPLAISAALATGSHAAVIVSDDFTYANGTLNGKGTVAGGWTGAWTTIPSNSSTTVASNAVSTSGAVGTWNYRQFSTGFTGSSVAPLYFSATFSKTGAVDADYAMWANIGTTTGVNPLGVSFGLTADKFSVRLRGASEGIGDFGTATVGQTYTIVGKLEFNIGGVNERVTIWVNPTGIETGGTSSAAITGQNVGWETPSVADVGSWVLNVGSGQIDNLKIGDSWSSVAIPEPSSALLGGLGLLALLRRRR